MKKNTNATPKKKGLFHREAMQETILLCLFLAIMLVLAFTPLGMIQLPFIKATILHVPVIIGSILFGPKKGAVLGFFFGLCSFASNTFTPVTLSFAFSPLISAPGMGRGSLWALAVCFVPRLLVGILPGYVFRLTRLPFKKENLQIRTVQLAVTGAVSSFVFNTVLVMGLIYILFRDAYASMKGVSADAVLGLILGVVGTNGVMEAIAAAVLTAAVCIPMQRLMKRDPLKTGTKSA